MKQNLSLYLFVAVSVTVFGQQPDMKLLRAKAFLSQQKTDEALVQLSNAKPSVLNYKLLGECYFQKMDYSNALVCYLRADSIQKNSCNLELAQTFACQNDLKNAINWLQKYLTLPEKCPEIDILKDPVFRKFYSNSAWDALWEHSWYSVSEVEKNTVVALLFRGNISAAQAEIDRYKDNISPRHLLNAIQATIYEQQKLYEPALSSINQALEQTSRFDEYFALRASIYFKLSRYLDAVQDITQAMKLNLYQSKYYLLRNEYARLAGNLELAESDLKIYKQLYPDSTETLHQCGLLETAKGYYHNALDYYDQLIQKKQNNAQLYMERGLVNVALNRNTNADEDYGMALDIDPTLTEAYLKKGQILVEAGDTVGGCYCLKKAKLKGNGEAARLLYEKCKE